LLSFFLIPLIKTTVVSSIVNKVTQA